MLKSFQILGSVILMHLKNGIHFVLMHGLKCMGVCPYTCLDVAYECIQAMMCTPLDLLMTNR